MIPVITCPRCGKEVGAVGMTSMVADDAGLTIPKVRWYPKSHLDNEGFPCIESVRSLPLPPKEDNTQLNGIEDEDE